MSERLLAAVRAGDEATVRAIVGTNPDLANRDGVLHAAVLAREPALVRILMEHGANARVGVYPHRDATSPFTIAMERGYDDVVAVIREQEERLRQSAVREAGSTDALFEALQSRNDERVRGLVTADPGLARTRHPGTGLTPRHVTAYTGQDALAAWLLDRGADLAAEARDMTPLDAAVRGSPESFAAMAQVLAARGAVRTPLAAVALGDAEWLRRAHADGTLANPLDDNGGLLTAAVRHDRAEMLGLLLDFGLDPDERVRLPDLDGDEAVYTWGMPLWHAVRNRKHGMAGVLLDRGADPNADVYASGTPMFMAYSGHTDWNLVELLRRYGGRVEPFIAGYFRQTDLARDMLTASDDKPTVAEELLDAAATGGDPEIVRLALEHVDWPRDDPRWFAILEQPLRIWNHGNGPWARHDWDRTTYPKSFGLVLERCDPNIRGRLEHRPPFGLTLLHSVAGSREHVTPDERLGFATMLLDAGARLDMRDQLLTSTPLGWACRWGRMELVELLLDRGADPVEADAPQWATPLAWAEKMNHGAVVDLLSDRLQHRP
ncbi:MAG: hypothetical protein OXH15_06140 [Gammaproteobacteria bacterium]|nr:hypothetical protein [Gammaproteobacteria bacterium]